MHCPKKMILFCLSAITYLYCTGVHIGNTAVMQFCRGESPSMANIVWSYNGITSEAQAKGVLYQNVTIAINYIALIIELFLYVLLFR